MKFDFSIGKVNRPIVSISKYNFTFNKDAIEMLGKPKFIAIGLDKDNKKLAFKAVDAKDFNGCIYPFVTNTDKHQFVTLSATEIRNEAIKLMPQKPNTNGFNFNFEIDSETKYGIIDLTAGQEKNYKIAGNKGE